MWPILVLQAALADAPSWWEVPVTVSAREGETTELSASAGLLAGSDSLSMTLDPKLQGRLASSGIVVAEDGAVRYTPPLSLGSWQPFGVEIPLVRPDGSQVSRMLWVRPVAKDDPPTPKFAEGLVDRTTRVAKVSLPLAELDDYLQFAEGVPPTVALTNDGDGVVTCDGASCVVTYTAPSTFSGTAEVSYRVTDSAGQAADGRLVFRAPYEGAAPTLKDATVTLSEDATVRLALLSPEYTTDLDSKPGDLTARVVADPTDGRLVSVGGGAYDYRPRANFSGTDRLVFTVDDGRLVASRPATVTLVVDPVSDAPSVIAGGKLTYNPTRPGDWQAFDLFEGPGRVVVDADEDDLTVRSVVPPEGIEARIIGAGRVLELRTVGVVKGSRLAIDVGDDAEQPHQLQLEVEVKDPPIEAASWCSNATAGLPPWTEYHIKSRSDLRSKFRSDMHQKKKEWEEEREKRDPAAKSEQAKDERARNKEEKKQLRTKFRADRFSRKAHLRVLPYVLCADAARDGGRIILYPEPKPDDASEAVAYRRSHQGRRQIGPDQPVYVIVRSGSGVPTVEATSDDADARTNKVVDRGLYLEEGAPARRAYVFRVHRDHPGGLLTLRIRTTDDDDLKARERVATKVIARPFLRWRSEHVFLPSIAADTFLVPPSVQVIPSAAIALASDGSLMQTTADIIGGDFFFARLGFRGSMTIGTDAEADPTFGFLTIDEELDAPSTFRAMLTGAGLYATVPLIADDWRRGDARTPERSYAVALGGRAAMDAGRSKPLPFAEVFVEARGTLSATGDDGNASIALRGNGRVGYARTNDTFSEQLQLRSQQLLYGMVGGSLGQAGGAKVGVEFYFHPKSIGKVEPALVLQIGD